MNEKEYLKWLAEEGKIFHQKLAENLSKNGIKVNARNAERLYTVASQTFWRIWLENSNVRSKLYASSKQGVTLKEFLQHHKYFWNFPSCVQGLCEDIRHQLIEVANNCLDEIRTVNGDDQEAVRELILDELAKRQSSFQNAVIQIEELKRMNSFSRAIKKRKLKKNAVQQILIPLVWENLLRQFKANPQSFVNF